MSLLIKVQKGEIKPPTRREFKEKVWKETVEATGADREDKELAEAALWISARLAALRSMVSLVQREHPLSVEARVRALVAMCNRETILARLKSNHAVRNGRKPGNIVLADETIGLKIPMAGGGEFSPDEIFQSVVDSAQIPIKMLLEGQYEESGGQGKIDWDEVGRALNVGVAYAMVEDQWDQIVWRGYSMVSGGSKVNPAIFIPLDKDLSDWEAESTYREQTLISARVHMMMRELYSDPDYFRSILSSVGVAKNVVKNGKAQRIVIGKMGTADISEIARALILEGHMPEYYAELRKQQSPLYPNLTLDLIIKGWSLLGSLARLIGSTLEKIEMEAIDAPSDGIVDLNQYLRVFKNEAIIVFLMNGSGASREQAKELLGFFTYIGKADQELWTQPLVRVSKDAVAPIFCCLVDGNNARNIDRWMQQIGYDMSPRGHLFETYLRAVFAQAKVSNEIKGKTKIIRNSFTLHPPGEREEEIDVVMVIGSMVVVGEAKCALRPIADESWFRHVELIRGAVSQVKRKAQAIDVNRETFIKQLAEEGVVIEEDFSILPMVLLNSPIHAGRMVDGVAIADELLVTTFLSNELMQGVSLSINDAPAPAKIIRFYDDVDGIATAALTYFSSPPQLEHIRSSLVWRKIPSALAPDDEVVGLIHVRRNVEIDIEAALEKFKVEPASTTD